MRASESRAWGFHAAALLTRGAARAPVITGIGARSPAARTLNLNGVEWGGGEGASQRARELGLGGGEEEGGLVFCGQRAQTAHQILQHLPSRVRVVRVGGLESGLGSGLGF